MNKFQWIAFGVLMGFAVSTGVGGLITARADQQGPSPAQAKAALDRENAVLEQIAKQWEETNARMQASMQAQTTTTGRAMANNMMEMHTQTKMLVQVDQGLVNLLLQENGAHNK